VNRVLRWILIILALAVAVVVLFTAVFPWFDRTFIDDPTLDAAAAALHA
jgi:hypothetical protein